MKELKLNSKHQTNLKGRNKNLSLNGLNSSVSQLKIYTCEIKNHVIMPVHACREEKIMAIGGEKWDENDRGSDQGKMCFVRLPLTFLASPATLNLFDNPV